MQQRHEAADSLDDFPTPPWATRALIRHVIGPAIGGEALLSAMSVWEPACNRGFMARPLAEYFGDVYASDVCGYGWVGQGAGLIDFLIPGLEPPAIEHLGVDWIISNPPFRLAEQFIQRGLDLARRGVAMLVRTSFLEGVGRHNSLYADMPPSIIAQFAERVPMVRGRYDPEASTATSYCWVVWVRGHAGTKFVWIPPCRRELERKADWEVEHA